MEKNRDKFLREYAWGQLKQVFGVGSMKAVNPETFMQWIEETELAGWLP